MELAQVRYFVTLCRTLNFTRAAEACNVSQPALTRAVQKLEDELGGPLLYRERALTQLTELGRTMRPHLEAMLAAAEAAHEIARARRGGEPARLRLGLGPAIGAGRVAPVVRELARRWPEIAVQFEEGGPAMLAEALLADTLDCALLAEAPDLPERLNRWPLYAEGCVVVLPASHPLAARERITGEDLAGETLLAGTRCGGFAQALAAGMAGVMIRDCGGGWPQLLDLVAAGLGLALLPEGLALPAGLAARPLERPALARRVMLAAVAGRPQGPAVANFVKLCRARSFA